MTELPLSGVKVVDFCWIGAGSYTTKLLADLGADVIKVESSKSLDSLRLAAPYAGGIKGVNRSGYFADRNSSKRSITINMKDPRGVAIVHQLIQDCDIVANNFRPGTMDKLGVGYQALREMNPGLIFIGMSMNGDEGPDRTMLGYGITIAALTSFLGLSGYPDREPTGTGTNYPDHVPNPCHGAFAIMCALRHKNRTGEGQLIDMAQTEPMLSLMPIPVMDYSVNGRMAGRIGNRLEGYSPRGVYPVQGEDRWIAISVSSDEQWLALCSILGGPDLVNPEWEKEVGRHTAMDEIDRAIATQTADRDGYALMQNLQAQGVTSGVVQNASDLVDRDPQLKHRNHWRYLPHKEMGDSLYNGPPFQFASGPIGPRFAAPLLGEHNREVLTGKAGLDDLDIHDLVEQDVLV
ncbi:CoA transferase [Sphingobium sp. D43FB]|uniref:CaiB/BaiF CoA transferase family protein n=1 Tax=Sphingobium sp. D43FB TaxID=2017595 RepID=UPI000BB571F4|nr:CoA transferase [Sphingobium sp. D43FB]PBN41780.1 CoA-transferase [Sphingobium sp. D43FB]